MSKSTIELGNDDTKNSGTYDLMHSAFSSFIFLYALLSIYHIMLLAICTTHVRKRFLKKEKKNKVTENFFKPGDSNPDPQNQLDLKVNALYPIQPWQTPILLSLIEIYIPSLW